MFIFLGFLEIREGFQQDNLHYVFWKGDFPSTFRICYTVFILKEKVQPVYVSEDNRKASEKEKALMDDIRQSINEKSDKSLLMKPIEINSIVLDDDIRRNRKFFKRNNYNYGNLMQACRTLKRRIELSVNKDTKWLYNMIKNYVETE